VGSNSNLGSFYKRNFAAIYIIVNLLLILVLETLR
jgi:hypothetical protein